jgi:hypothetical protein
MQTLLSEHYAPITSSIGFLRISLEEAVDALTAWRNSHAANVATEELQAAFPQCLHALEPLTGGAKPRELLVETSGGWIAYFDCSLQGTDATTTIGYLSRSAGCQGLAIDVVPHTVGRSGNKPGRYGAVQFEMFGPLPTEFLNYVRTVSVAHDGGRWVFTATGTVQWFEEVDAYKVRRARDRFNSDMLSRYCQALDLDVFNPASYGPRAVLVRSEVKIPPEGKIMSIPEVQEWLGIVPGMADKLPG